MAHVSSLHSISSSSSSSYPSFNPSSSRLGKCRPQRRPICCKTEDRRDHHPTILTCGDGSPITTRVERRQILLQTVFAAAVSIPAMPALADNDVVEDFRSFTDDVNKFKISIPRGWQIGAGEPNGFKSITAFYPEGASTSNGTELLKQYSNTIRRVRLPAGLSAVSVVITGLGADFTRMESFGKVESFAENLVSGLDRSWQRPPGVTAKLIDAKSSKGFYYIEYSLQNPGESCRHIYTAIGMATNGWYNRLYTVTGQFMDEESDKYSAQIEKAVASFKFT